MAITYESQETRAIALASLSLAFALAGMLKRTGVLDPEAVENTFEAALSGSENAFSPDDRAAALARQLLDLMGGQLAAHVKSLGAPTEQPDRQRLRRPRKASPALARQ